MAEPVVTVCVPTFNGEHHLEACLESVLDQTFTDFELLVVDDASRDRTTEVAERFRRQDPRVRIERNPRNLGLGGNWNRCVDLATGEWLKFVHKDDVIAPTCIEALLAARRPHCPLVACKRVLQFDDDGDAVRADYRHTVEHSIDSLFGEVPYVSGGQVCGAVLDHFGVNFVGEPTAVLVARDAFGRFGGFNERLPVLCDFEYWARVGGHTGLAYVPETLATFRVHARAISTFNRTVLRSHWEWLDPLILRAELASAPVYAPHRRVAADRRPPIDLTRAALDQAALARRRAEQSLRTSSPPDPSFLRAWRNVVSSYPMLSRSPRLRALDLRYAVGRRVRPRSPSPAPHH